MDSPINVLAWSSKCSSLSCLGRRRRCAILDGALSDLVTGLATTEAGEGRATYGGRRSGPPRASSLSGVTRIGTALSGAVVVGGVGTTSMAQSGHSPLCIARAGLRKHVASVGPGHERNSQTNASSPCGGRLPLDDPSPSPAPC
jgi:hypothetical protein